MLKLDAISKSYQTADIMTLALDKMDMEIKEGEFVSIMGPSGSGKSTLLNILGLLDNPTSGQYFFFGEDVSGYGEKKLSQIRKKYIGFVFQEFNLIDELTVSENVELSLLYQGLSSKERKDAVESILCKMDIAHRAKHYPGQLSGGQQQRVAIARALVGKPKLILADEPTGNLDSQIGEEVMNMLLELNREGTTLVMVTHSEEHARAANRVLSLLDGKLREGSMSEANNKANHVAW
ncbi:ABC transporter ATP-binding protein [Pseudoalteromonas umbrosa]|uniref:ABC transporter ATP-binding protein n=1 Tax=Pseudoalteromonas umbrosa TaxID=3048489 RepID=UPI0024C44CA4|nr:ABC transporter ATP-binding protein [Pseudoalteromonas sp. B95]MDK1288227.1 ABC transporter ATP-binding protein [Pseudoalteromonas sp. B95]